MPTLAQWKNTCSRSSDALVEALHAGARVLRRFYGAGLMATVKENQSSVVTQADLESEKAILARIHKHFPRHNVIAEESGCQTRGSEFTWVIDPLDGTSNFAAGLPWFGVMVALFQGPEVIQAGMYLPVDDVLYLGEKGRGVKRNGVPLPHLSTGDLHQLLWAYGMDAAPNQARSHRQVALLERLVARVRNVRATNCLVDFCYTLEGRLGGFLNQNTKIWDIAPICLLLPEVGGAVVDLAGNPIRLELSPETWSRNYAVLGTSRRLLPRILAVLKRRRNH